MNLLLAMMLVVLSPSQGDEPARAEAAREHYRENRFAAAAAEFEALWRDYKLPKYLYNAGLAREGLGHDAHAILHWQRFLAHPGVGAAESKKARTKLDAVLLRTTAVNLRLGPVDALEGATVKIQRGDGGRAALELAVSELRGGATPNMQVHLEAGTWKISLEPARETAAGFLAAEGTLVVAKGQTAAALELTLVESPPATLEIQLAPRRARRAGATLVLRGQSGESPAPLRLRKARSSATLPQGRWEYTATAPGFGDVHGEIDLTQPQALAFRLERALTAEELLDRRRRIGFGVGLGIAGAAVAGGGIYLITSGEAQFNAFPVMESGDRYPKDATLSVSDRSAAGAGLLGATLGLWTGAVTGAIRPRARAAWVTQVVMGSALMAGGLSWCILSYRRWTDGALRGDEYLDGAKTEKFHAPILLSSSLAGLGAGLIPGAVTGLVLARRSGPESKRAYAIRPAVSIHTFGLRLTGAF